MSANPPKLLIGVPEIAAYIGRTERQVSWMIESGKLPVFHLGTRWAMTADAYDQLLASRSAEALTRVQ